MRRLREDFFLIATSARLTQPLKKKYVCRVSTCLQSFLISIHWILCCLNFAQIYGQAFLGIVIMALTLCLSIVPSSYVGGLHFIQTLPRVRLAREMSLHAHLPHQCINDQCRSSRATFAFFFHSPPPPKPKGSVSLWERKAMVAA